MYGCSMSQKPTLAHAFPLGLYFQTLFLHSSMNLHATARSAPAVIPSSFSTSSSTGTPWYPSPLCAARHTSSCGTAMRSNATLNILICGLPLPGGRRKRVRPGQRSVPSAFRICGSLPELQHFKLSVFEVQILVDRFTACYISLMYQTASINKKRLAPGAKACLYGTTQSMPGH